MKQKIIPILVSLMVLALLGIVCIQYQWVKNTIGEKQKLIDVQVYHAIANVEEQLNNYRGMQIIKDSILGNSSFISSIIEDKYAFTIKNTDSVSSIKFKILSNVHDSFKTKSQVFIHKNIQSNTAQAIATQSDDITKVLEVLEKINLEGLNSNDDNRLDSTKIKTLLRREFDNILPNTTFNWGVYDVVKQQFIIRPSTLIDMDYKVPLFSTDIIFPNRYEIQLKLNRNKLIWSSIRSTVLLSVLFMVIIISVFYFSVKLLIKHKNISQIKSDFINNMTHEFKTPLASISLAADSLIHPNANLTKAYLKEYVEIIQQEKKKLNTNVERILEVAALNHNALKIDSEKVEITILITNVIRNLGLLIKKNNVKIRFKSQHPIWGIANRTHLENVLGNLIENSIKYRTETPIINIDVKEKDNVIHIIVKDNGIGMTSKQLNRVFDDFYRVQTGDLHNSKGFGLGLTYSKLVMEKMGGRIKLESDIQKGTIATLIIKKGR